MSETVKTPLKPPHPRVQARVLAVQFLYAWEAQRFIDDGDLMPPQELANAGSAATELARGMMAGVAAHRTAIDAAIDGRLNNWTIHRLAATDRAILRLATWELLFELSIPPKVAITQAVALSHAFGSDDKTPRLVNGVLDRLAREHRGLGATSATAAAAPTSEPS